jgi:hypothetical protein
VILRIYIASTPYHLLVIGALQIGQEDTSAVVMYDDQYEFLAHVGGIASLFPNLKVEPLQPYDRSMRLGRALKSRISAHTILRRIKDTDSPELYFCCPTRRDVLRVAYSLKGSVPIHFVEDGLDAYLPHGITKPDEGGTVKQSITRWINGFPSPDSFDTTMVMEYEKFHLLFPAIRRSTIPIQQVKQIEHSWFVGSVKRMRTLTDKLTPDDTPTDIWFPSLSVHLQDVSSYVRSVERQLAAVRAESTQSVCAVKCHPREENQELLLGLNSLEMIHYPPWLPAELLLHKFDPGCTIRTGLSTFVLSSMIVSPGRAVWLDSSVNQEYRDSFNRWEKSLRSVF